MNIKYALNGIIFSKNKQQFCMFVAEEQSMENFIAKQEAIDVETLRKGVSTKASKGWQPLE